MTEAEVKLLVDSWNSHWPLGTAVRVLLDDLSIRKSKTRSEAWIVAGKYPLINVDGIDGGYSLYRVAPDWDE